MSGTASPREWRYARSYPTGLRHAFDEVLAIDLRRLFDRWHGPLPPISEVRDQPGRWGHEGQTRVVATADRGTVRETLTEVEQPRVFRYRLDQVRGPMRTLIGAVDGAWEFEPAGTGVRVVWTWRVHPANRAAALGLPALGRLWQGYARKAFDRIEDLLVP